MAPDFEGHGTPGRAEASGEPVRDAGVLGEVQALWKELRALTGDRFHLAALETQRAGKSLVVMIVAGMMLAIVLGGAWLGLMAAAVMALVGHGVAATDALLLAVASNLVCALILWGVIRRKSRYLGFPATRRSLQALPEALEDVESS